MAEAAHTSVFPSFLSVAAQNLCATPKAHRNEWDRKLAEYLRGAALKEAFTKFGELGFAAENNNRANLMAKSAHGPNYLRTPEGLAQIMASGERLDAATDVWAEQYADPLHELAVELMRLPAPDEAALLAKIEIIEAEELYLYSSIGMEAMDCVAADAARLGVEA
ncbi:hypothetical protein [Novosphingobium colocasiae]|uniref:hypothetical protein n=1 Tax=Novosphingobium colocasiae TaxID=1256513 RepID=UPI0035B07F1F